MKVKCLIVDDEPLAVEVIKNHIAHISILEIVATCNRASEAFSVLKTKEIDLLFLDIKMPGITGIEFLKTLERPPKVILTTAYREYAIEGYELNIVDYLLKPIPFDRFLKAVNKFINQAAELNKVIVNDEKESCDEFLFVKENKKVHKILLKDITYIESLKDYVKIHTPSKNIVTKYALSKLEQSLSENDFIRIHRSFIVGVNHIAGFTANCIEINNKELPIGRMYSKQVFEKLNFKVLGE